MQYQRTQHRTLAALALSILAGGTPFATAQNSAQPTPTAHPTPKPPDTEKLGPGITLYRKHLLMPDGPVEMYVVRTRLRQWRLRIATAGPSVMKRAPVSKIAAPYKVPVAVNGGYFAFEGAAVGAVKLNDHWLRLPWKDRTAFGVGQHGSVKIDNLHAMAWVRIGQGHSFPIDNLNGFPATNTLCLLTPAFGDHYKLKDHQRAIVVNNGAICEIAGSNEISIPPNGWALVASDDQRAYIEQAKTGQAAIWRVVTTPNNWESYPCVLGAGPRLLKGGQVHVTDADEEFKPDVIHRGPRTAIGVDERGNPLIVVVDGRQSISVGLTLPDLANEMKKMGIVDAMSLDGGSSTVLVVNGKVINHPSAGQEVYVSNAVMLEKVPPVPHRSRSIPHSVAPHRRKPAGHKKP